MITLSPQVRALPWDDWLKLAMQAAVDAFHVPASQVTAHGRREPGVSARQVACWLCIADLGWSVQTAAWEMGVTRSNALNSVRQVCNHIETEPLFHSRWARARALLKEACSG